ncbi:MAG: hypothetical protein M3471_02140 [Actinomycetota bacterium]|nr:hypothetical protein [Actinomycetota bacterium]
MWDGPNLFKIAEAEWGREAERRPARGACARWAQHHDVLEGMASPAEVVRCCQVRGHPRRSAAVLAAVLSHAGDDPWAARTVLQAVLPGLASVSRRARPLVGPMGVWLTVDELDQHVMVTACERIATLAGEAPRPWPAAAIVDSTWQRLRDFASAERRRSGRRADLVELGEPVSVPEASAAEELANVLAEAVERGILEPVDGWLVFASRVQGRGVEDLAAEMGCHPRWLWRRRVHAERLLAGAGPMLAAG